MIKLLFIRLFDILSTMFALHVFGVEWSAQDEEGLMTHCWPVEL